MALTNNNKYHQRTHEAKARASVLMIVLRKAKASVLMIVLRKAKASVLVIVLRKAQL